MNKVRRISIMLMIVFMVIGVNSFSFAGNCKLKGIPDVNIYIDGIKFETNEDFYSYNNTTLVPMRALFEELGADVEWIQETKTIIAKTGENCIELGIGQKTAKINGSNIELTVEPKLINKVTYLPLRFVSKALDYEVDWNNRNKIISIVDLKQIAGEKHCKSYASSLSFKDDYMEMEIINNSDINIKGITGLDKTNWLFKVEGKESFRVWKDIKANKTYEETLNLKNNLKEGDYKISVYFKDNNDSTYWSYYKDIPLTYENGEMFFPMSPVYEDNYLQYMINSVVDPNDYLDIGLSNKSERDKIRNLAKNITKGAKSDYKKALKINEWVAQNIYYNWDGLLSGKYGKTDAYGTLEGKRSVCQGYAELTNALLKSAGIPSRLVTGHALGVSSSGNSWDGVDHTKSNHAWNEAFVDGRWITIDATWNSGNKYENGKFNKGNMSYRYFDPSLESISYTHKLITGR